MKNKALFIAVIAISLFAASCGNKATEKTNAAATAHHDHIQKSEAIELNNGQKWQVNVEMVPFILGSEKILNDYVSAGSNDWSLLATQLKEKNSGLIKSCTMKGKSHDELHKWLHPHMELINAMSQAKSGTDAEVLISELKKSFEAFHLYFQ